MISIVLILACLLAPVIASVAPSPAPTYLGQEEAEKQREEYIQARAKWENTGITTYSHTQQFNGLVDGEWRMSILVQVVNDTLVSRTFEDGTSLDDTLTSPLDLRTYVVSINEMFDFIRSKIGSSTNIVTVTYNDPLGYPTFISWRPVQPGGGYIHEPIIFSIRNLLYSPVDGPTSPPTTEAPTSHPTDVCPSFGCCVEDCCGPGTVWAADYCLKSIQSSGWDGTYSSEFDPGCVERVCCEASCCGENTQYDSELESCVPDCVLLTTVDALEEAILERKEVSDQELVLCSTTIVFDREIAIRQTFAAFLFCELGGTCVFDGNNATRLFSFEDCQYELFFKGFTFQNGNLDQVPMNRPGAALKFDGLEGSYARFEDCSFVDNSAIGSNGGAIFANQEGTLEFVQCAFEQNYAYNGGAISSIDVDIVVQDTSFVNNTAIGLGEGAAIFLGSNDPPNMKAKVSCVGDSNAFSGNVVLPDIVGPSEGCEGVATLG